MKHKLFTLCLALVASVATMFAEIYSGTCGENLSWELNTLDSTLTISGSGEMNDYQKGHDDLRAPWYWDSEYIKTVNLPNGLTSIGDNAFYGCSVLTSITIPDNVTRIGSNAFGGCIKLPFISIPNSITSISYSAFHTCSSLNSIVIPSSVTNIEEYAFAYCSNLTSVTIGNSVLTIGANAFQNCNVQEIHFTGSIEDWCSKSWSAGSFTYQLRTNYDLYIQGVLATDVIIPDNVQNLGKFLCCSSLTSISIGNGVRGIGDNAFYNCPNLASVSIGQNVDSIGSSAFYKCTALTSVVIPNNVTKISSSAFASCSNLSEITIGEGVTTADNAFSGCKGLRIVHWNAIEYPGSSPFYSNNLNTAINSITFGPKVKRIPDNMFYGQYVENITLPESVEEIGGSAFANCTLLSSINLPDSLRTIGGAAFYNCNHLNTITIPENVESIGNSVFYNCSSLNSITISENVESIGNSAFYNCSSLNGITIPGNVKSIGNNAFFGCTNLKKVYSPSIEAWLKIVFENEEANPLTKANVLYVNNKILRDLVIPGSVNRINQYAFQDCSTLSSITIPGTVYSIRDHAFYNCNGVSAIYNYASSPQTINSNTLYNINRNFCTLYVQPGSIEAYQEADVWNMFLHIEAAPQRCGDNLTWEVVNDTLFISGSGEMWDYSYSHPWSDTIVAISLPEGLTRIGNYAFYNCSRLESVDLPASVTSIGSRAWSGCYMIQSVACYAENPPMVDKNDLPNVSDWCYLYVPEQYLDAYKSDSNWSEYENIRAIGNCGDHLYWQKTNGALTITGSGDMYDFNTYPPVPWGSGVTAVTLSEGVTSIGTYAFMHEYGLHSIELPNSLSKIAVGAFVYSGLQTVKLPENLTQIEGYVFSQCTQLTSIYNAALVPQTIETSVFNGVNTSSCTLYVPEESIEAYRAADVWNSFANILPIPELPEEPIDTLISVAQAIEIGQALENHAQTEMMYTIVGYVSVLAGREDDFERYNNQTYWITDERGSTAASAADGAFEVFRGIASEEVHVGDKVSVYGVISRYDEIIESVRPQVTILEKSPVEEPAEVVQLPYSESFLGDMGLFTIHDVEKDTLPFVWQTTPAYGMKASGYYSGPHNTESWLISPKISLPAAENINMSFETCLNYASDDYNSCAVKIFVDNTWSDLQFNKWPAGHSWAYDTVTTSLDTYAGNEIRVAFVYRSSTLYSNATWEVRNLVIKQEEIQDTIPTTQYSGSCGENLTWDLTNGILTISGHGEMPAFTASNPAPWYIYAAAIQSVILTNGVTNIGQYAFYNCTALTSVSMTSSVNSIGYAAFAACSNLTSIEIPNGVTNIEQYAFYNCTALTSASMTNSVNSIGYAAFAACSNLTSIEIPNGVTNIEQYAFSSCSNLTNITLPNTITKIDTATFNGCSSLTSIEIPNSVKSIAYCAFFDCYNLRKCVIPEGVTTIGDMVFCSSGSTIHMESLTLPSTIISIGDYLFCEDDDNWPDIYVPCGEMERFQQMLNNNDKIQYAPLSIYRITITESERGYTTVSNYGRNYTVCDDIDVQINATPSRGYKFVSWTDGNIDNPRYIRLTQDTTMEAVYDYQLTGKCGKDNVLTWTYNPETKALAITGEGELTDDNYPYGRFMDSLTIGEGITRIGGGDLYAFGSCANLKSITIPSSLISINGEEFGYCPNLSSVHIADLDAWCTIQFAAPSSNPLTAKLSRFSNDVVVGADLYLNGELVTDLVIPDSITTIGDFSFLYCNSLTSVKIPDSVTQIGRSAFLGCQNMRSVIIGNNVTDINNLAFVYCSGLKSITCKAATPPVFTIVESMYSADLHPFEGDDTTHCALFVPAESVEAYKAADGWRAFKHIYPLQAEEVTVNEPTAEPTTNSVVIEWPQNEDAETYTIVIKKGNETICTLEFDASGRLLNIAFAVPARDHQTRQAHTAIQTSIGWQYTIGGLEANTDYTYTVVARRNDNSEVYNTTVQFRTQATITDIDQIINDKSKSIKLLRDGQILILRGKKVYTLEGQEVR